VFLLTKLETSRSTRQATETRQYWVSVETSMVIWKGHLFSVLNSASRSAAQPGATTQPWHDNESLRRDNDQLNICQKRVIMIWNQISDCITDFGCIRESPELNAVGRQSKSCNRGSWIVGEFGQRSVNLHNPTRVRSGMTAHCPTKPILLAIGSRSRLDEPMD